MAEKREYQMKKNLAFLDERRVTLPLNMFVCFVAQTCLLFLIFLQIWITDKEIIDSFVINKV